MGVSRRELLVALLVYVGVLVVAAVFRQAFNTEPYYRSPWVSEQGWQESALPQLRKPISEQIRSIALSEGLDPALVAAIVQTESDFQHEVQSPRGAVGLMQVLPQTAAFLGFPSIESPEENLRAGCRYLRWLFDDFGDDVELVIAAYNAGPGAIYRYGGIPPFRETKTFLMRVRKAYMALTGQPLAAARPGF